MERNIRMSGANLQMNPNRHEIIVVFQLPFKVLEQAEGKLGLAFELKRIDKLETKILIAVCFEPRGRLVIRLLWLPRIDEQVNVELLDLGVNRLRMASAEPPECRESILDLLLGCLQICEIDEITRLTVVDLQKCLQGRNLFVVLVLEIVSSRKLPQCVLRRGLSSHIFQIPYIVILPLPVMIESPGPFQGVEILRVLINELLNERNRPLHVSVLQVELGQRRHDDRRQVPPGQFRLVGRTGLVEMPIAQLHQCNLVLSGNEQQAQTQSQQGQANRLNAMSIR